MIYYIVKTKYRGVKMSIEKVKEYFAEYGRENDILEFVSVFERIGIEPVPLVIENLRCSFYFILKF